MTGGAPRAAVFPGSFDPLTVGHVDLIDRAVSLFGSIVIAVLVNPDKRPLLPLADRLGLLREVFAGRPEIEVATFEGLLADFAHRRGARVVLRGLRNGADFEYEAQMAAMNRHLAGDLETVFLSARPEFGFVRSSLVKEVFSLGGDVRRFVPPAVHARLQRERKGR